MWWLHLSKAKAFRQPVATAYSIPMLDNATKLVLRGLADGLISDIDAERLAEALEALRLGKVRCFTAMDCAPSLSEHCRHGFWV